MANEMVKHHNDLNTVPMRNWTSEEMNFFFSILAKLRDKGTAVVEFNRRELSELADYSDWNLPRFKKIMDNLGDHITSIKYYERTSHSFKIMNLFSVFEMNWNDDLSDLSVKVGVTENFEYILNKLNAEFTVYELEEFTQIRSTYAKTMYRLLKQWRTVGKKEYSIEQLKTLLDCPESYRPSEIDKAVIKPVMRELPAFFEGLKIKKVKANTRGTPVKSYIFSWKPEKTSEYDPKKFEKKTYGKPLKFESKPDWMTDDKQSFNQQASSEESKNIKDELLSQYPNFFDKN